ncbi:hypothetical protein Ocin01_02585, partial [Orchesella cincta]
SGVVLSKQKILRRVLRQRRQRPVTKKGKKTNAAEPPSPPHSASGDNANEVPEINQPLQNDDAVVSSSCDSFWANMFAPGVLPLADPLVTSTTSDEDDFYPLPRTPGNSPSPSDSPYSFIPYSPISPLPASSPSSPPSWSDLFNVTGSSDAIDLPLTPDFLRHHHDDDVELSYEDMRC